MGLAAPTELGEAPGTWRGGCLTTSARCERQRPSNLRLHRGWRAEGPQGGGLGWGQQRCWETRQEPLLGAGAGRTQTTGQKRQECWAGTRSPGRWARLGGGMAPVGSLSFLTQGMGRSGLRSGGLSSSEAVWLPILCQHEGLVHYKDPTTCRDTLPGRRGHGTTAPTGRQQLEAGAAGREGPPGQAAAWCRRPGDRLLPVPPMPRCPRKRRGHLDPAPPLGPWSWQTHNCPTGAPSPGWGDPIPPCGGQPDPAPGPHLGDSPLAVGVGCSTAGRRHPAANLPRPAPSPWSSQENGPLCGSQAHCAGPASRWGLCCARHAEPGTAPSPRLDIRVFRPAHMCAPGFKGKACCDPGPPATLAGDRVLPAPAHLPSHSCWDNGRVAEVTGCSDGQLWTPSSLRRRLRAAAARPPPGARPSAPHISHNPKGYILTAPDRVPMAMIRSSGSKASALGWLGKPCSTVCREVGVFARHSPHPRPTQGSLQLCPCCMPGPPTSASSAARWMTTLPAGEEGPEPWPHHRPSQPRPIPLDTWVHDNKQNGAHKGGCAGTDANPSCPTGRLCTPLTQAD